MLNILIVDDDMIIRKGLIKIISQLDVPIDVFIEAEDGEIALQILTASPPSIVITDIKMHRMNGIDFITQARQYTSCTQFIILSGYSDFEFAKAAIKNNVIEYLLKPLRKTELKQALETAIATYKQLQGNILLEDSLKKHFFKDCVVNFNHTLDYVELLKTTSIHLPFNSFVMTCFKVEMLEIDLSSLFKNQYFICSQYEDCYKYIYIIFNIDYDSHKTFIQYLESRLTLFSSPIFCGISSTVNNLNQLHRLMKESQIACLNRFIISDKITSYYTSTMLSVQDNLSLYTHYLNMNNALGSKDYYSFSLHLKYLLEAIINISHTSPTLLISCLELWWEKYILPTLASKIQIAELYHSAITLDVLKNNIVSYLEHALGKDSPNVLDSVLNTNHPKLITAIKYIHQNFSQIHAITDVSQYIDVTPNYLSKLFKTDLNMTFSEFLLQVRLNEAKRLLLDPQYKVYEIANLVGIEDDKYFFKLFKKYVGVTPNQYRLI